MFASLLSNATKFIERLGRVVLTTQVGTDTCEIVIADNGPGIPPEDLDRVFVPFRRSVTHKDSPGAGLGLYFAKNLVAQLGGRIWIASELGRGREFHIELRLAGASDP